MLVEPRELALGHDPGCEVRVLDSLVGNGRRRGVALEVHGLEPLVVEVGEPIAAGPEGLGLVAGERPDRAHEPPRPFEEPRLAHGPGRRVDRTHLLGG